MSKTITLTEHRPSDGLLTMRVRNTTYNVNIFFNPNAKIMGEARYSSLTRSFPDRAEVLFDKAEKTAKARRAHLEKLLKLYGE